jgi:hypothetical protein
MAKVDTYTVTLEHTDPPILRIDFPGVQCGSDYMLEASIEAIVTDLLEALTEDPGAVVDWVHAKPSWLIE